MRALTVNELIGLMKKVYRKQGYHFVGNQAVVKPCYWMKQALLSKGRKHCYKQSWYGVPSHRCLQMSPTILCTHRCIYCWRVQSTDIGLAPPSVEAFRDAPFDEPRDIVVNSVKKWKEILSGYKGNPKVDPLMLEEAMRPLHVTFSLVGEPTLYPRVGELVEEYFNYGFKTVFIVTNGTLPEVLSKLEREPSQLYVTLPAPDERTYKAVSRPLITDGWGRLLETLSLLKSFKCPTVIRITLVKGFNLKEVEKYAKLIEMAEPTYVEPKAAMDLGFYRRRLERDNMPRHEEIKEFSTKLAELTGYKIIGESLHSRIVLLSRLNKPKRFY